MGRYYEKEKIESIEEELHKVDLIFKDKIN